MNRMDEDEVSGENERERGRERARGKERVIKVARKERKKNKMMEPEPPLVSFRWSIKGPTPPPSITFHSSSFQCLSVQQ